MHIDLRKLRHFVTLARTGNFSHAAMELNISQPALSRSIAELEASVGETLFDRSRAGVIPTAFAKPMLHDAERVLAEAESMQRAMRYRKDGKIGSLAIGAGPLVASLGFPLVLATLAQERPHLNVQTTIAPGRALVDAVHMGQLEWAAFAEPLLDDPRSVDVTRIATIQPAYVVRKGHPLCEGHPLKLNDLRAYPMATGAEESRQHWSKSPSISGAAIPPTIRCDDFAILRQATLGSDMIWLAEQSLVDDDAGLAVLNVTDEVPHSIPIIIIHAKGRTPSPAARRAADLLREALAKEI